MNNKPLTGLVVLELGTSVAAPYAGLILSELGAEVIKVENPQGGDHARSWGPPFWKEQATSYLSLNRGKKSITVDLERAEDRDFLKRFIKNEVDAVVQNLRPGLLKKFGINPDVLRSEKPGLIWCDIAAFGSVGPLQQKPGYDPLVQASAGIMSVTGEGNRPPVRVGVSLVDMGSGMWTVIGLLSALLERAKSGQGCQVSTSLYETGLAWMTIPMAGHIATGEVRKPYGSGSAEIVPYQAFETRNGYLMIAAGNDGLFAKLCTALSLESLAQDERYKTNPKRVEHRDALITVLSERIAAWSLEELAAALETAGVPNAPLLNVEQVAQHEQFKAVNLCQPCEDDSLALTGIPLKFNDQRFFNKQRAPMLGEHNALIRNDGQTE